MSEQLNETLVNPNGNDANVINQKLKVKVGIGSTIFQIALWVLGIIPGLIFQYKKVKADNYLQQLQQKIQKNASQIDNYMEQRVMVLQNCAGLVEKAIDLDKSTFENIAKFRSGTAEQKEETRNQVASQVEDLSRNINLAVENYPDLKAHQTIKDAMRQNYQLQLDITAARELYNDSVNDWNSAIFSWPTKMIVAAKHGFTTKIPFSISTEMKEKARGTFF
ncbi:MAG: LemA family protein [Clostridia bacterium]|nr:LemA family protein [Clostridia bacterium]